MKSRIAVLLFLFPFLILSCKKGESKTEIHNRIVEHTINSFEEKLLEQQIDSIFSQYKFNGSVAVFRDSVKIYSHQNGFANFHSKTKIDSATVFAIASNSKQFTAALILGLSEEGKLKLSDKVSDYLESFKTPAYGDITIEQMLNHSSGLNTMGHALAFKSGTGFLYSNDAYNELGKIVEKVTGKSFDENARELFHKAGLEHTYTDKDDVGSNFAGAYLGTNGNPEAVPDMPKRLGSKAVGTPAGGLLTTVGDFHSWQRKLFSGQILDSVALDQMLTQSNTREDYMIGDVGYSYGLMMGLNPPKSYFHTGYVKGAPSLTVYYPETKTSLIIFSNVADDFKSRSITFKPHYEIKNIADVIQNTVTALRNELILTESK